MSHGGGETTQPVTLHLDPGVFSIPGEVQVPVALSLFLFPGALLLVARRASPYAHTPI